MKFWNAFWTDESGAILSAEAALLGTVGVLGAGVGISAIGQSLSDELKETAFAIRSLDQSYSYEGMKSPRAWTAGSHYQQPPVEESLKALQLQMDQQERELQEQRKKLERETPPDPAPPKDRKRQKGRQEAQAADPDWTIDGPLLQAPGN